VRSATGLDGRLSTVPSSALDGVGHNGPVTATDRVTPEVREFLADRFVSETA